MDRKGFQGGGRSVSPSGGFPETTLSTVQVIRIVEGQYRYPSSVLGIHRVKRGGVTARAIRLHRPGAFEAWVVAADSGERTPMKRIHPGGLFEAVYPGVEEAFPYRLATRGAAGAAGAAGVSDAAGGSEGGECEFEDAYHFRFQSLLTPADVDLFTRGEHWRIHEKMGGRLAANDGVEGVNFVVWAPNARFVSVVGTFNGWNAKANPMNHTRRNGLWELFIPGLGEGALYKFVIRAPGGKTWVKSDPYSYGSQLRPKKSSVVRNLDRYEWTDADWIRTRSETPFYRRPMSVYEVHLGSWIRKENAVSASESAEVRQGPHALRALTRPRPQALEGETHFYNYREIAEDLIPYVKDLGFTHIELMPVMEHPLDESWGYQVTSYFAPTSRHGTHEDFMFLVNRCHEAGVGVILDWVPAHFPRDPHGLSRFDGSHLYEHADPRQGYHPDWKTAIFNFGRHEVRNFLLANALFWIEKYHVDGLRVDAVASMLYLDYSRKPGQWVPNRYGGNENIESIAFLRDLNRLVHERHPGVVTIAEESTAWDGVTRPHYVGGLGFSYKWNMGWMHDTLDYLRRPPGQRRHHHGRLTFMLDYAFREKYVLVLSHDEVVHGKKSLLRKMPGEKPEKFANLRLLYGFLFAHPGKKSLFMGSEFAQWKEWAVNKELDWYLLDYSEHVQVQQYVRDLNRLYQAHSSLHELEAYPQGFQWVDHHDAQNSVIALLRHGTPGTPSLLFVFNFSDGAFKSYRVGVPREGDYVELLNSNAGVYGGSDAGNHPSRRAIAGPHHGFPQHIDLALPPLTMEIFRCP
jgi:1,4-alpha-glucan branching enzyme